MVITERVKNKVFTTYMDTKLYTAKIEYEAIAFINYAFANKFGVLRHSDAPDIQDENGVWGIEVVKVVSENDGRLEGEVSQYFRAKEENNYTKVQSNISKIERDGGKLINSGVMFPLQTDKKEKFIFQNAIRHKLEKLPQYKSKGFQHIGIYMLYDNPIAFGNYQERKQWLDEVQKEYEEKYDMAVVLYQDEKSWRISYYDFSTNNAIDKEISNDIANYVGKLGRMTAEGEVKENDPEWI